MELIKAILLGAIQGLTEFLPISSSGHLVIGSQIMNFQQQGVLFDVFLHLGTLLAVVVVFYKDILAMISAPFKQFWGTPDESSKMYLWWDVYVVLATIPAVIVGLFLKDHVEHLFTNLLLVYCMLLVTAAIMLCSRFLPKGNSDLNWSRSIVVGCAQACAIMPGLSRSGSTIFIGMALGMDREMVARFSFIMSVPAILGAALLQSFDIIADPPAVGSIFNLVAGTAVAAVSGYFAIVLLLDIVRRNRLHYFGYYCLVVALLGFGHHFLM